MPLPIVQFSSDKEKNLYSKYFDIVLPPGSGIFKLPSDTDVKSFFRLSKLPKNILEKIWDYVHQGSNVDQNSFNVGCRLIALAQANFDPNLLALNTTKVGAPRFSGHEQLLTIVDVDITRVPWMITKSEVESYRSKFVPNGKGQLPYDEGLKFFAMSGVNFVFLQHIWFLSDYDQDLALDFDEFCVAMHLIFGILGGKYTSLPNCLPVELIPPSKRGGLHESVKHAPEPTSKKDETKNEEFKWEIAEEASMRYQTLWQRQSINKPTISKSCIAEISLHAQVAQPLCEIAWSLVDVQNAERISKEQFIVMMHIIQQIHTGRNPPKVLPPDLAEKFLRISLAVPSLYANVSNSISVPSFPSIPNEQPQINKPKPTVMREPIAPTKQLEPITSNIPKSKSGPLESPVKDIRNSSAEASPFVSNERLVVVPGEQKPKPYLAQSRTMDSLHGFAEPVKDLSSSFEKVGIKSDNATPENKSIKDRISKFESPTTNNELKQSPVVQKIPVNSVKPLLAKAQPSKSKEEEDGEWQRKISELKEKIEKTTKALEEVQKKNLELEWQIRVASSH